MRSNSVSSAILSFIAVVCFSSIALSESDRRVREQPTLPEGLSELPFEESVPEPVPTADERQRGYLLFHRPITEPVHPNTRPLSRERLLGGLQVFATPGEWEPVTLGVYPLRDLKNFRVRVSELRGPGGTIDASHLTVRLQTYWNIGYPRYTSRKTYRRVPELLERVNVHSSPAKETQRWWIQIHVPHDASAGLYRGTVTIQDDGFVKAVEIPLSLRVLDFSLKQDPKKHYTAYYHPHDRVTYQDKDDAFFQKASTNEYRTMHEYGIDQFPTFYLVADREATKISINNEGEIRRLMAVGMRGRIPILGGNAITRIYQATTPGGKRGSHWKINIMPPPEFYKRVTKLFRDFEKDRIARGLPPVICCPLDEVASSHKEFGIKVFEAVRAAGIPTYITKFPTAADAANYAPFVDVWCSQPYAIPYEDIVSQNRHEYWSYPNHNAGERKNRRVMCKGGRMTYGFGFWRSGYTTLIPWHWSWTMPPSQFEYLRGSHSGTGMRIDENGEVIPTIYWECFREGRDDARYLYTLQQAVFERDGSSDPKCRQQLKVAKAMLQETWDAINVQERYLAEGMWTSAEFNARRWRLAVMTETLLAYPAKRDGVAPSVLVDNTGSRIDAGTQTLIEAALAKGIVSVRDVGEDFSQWKNDTIEGKIELTPKASVDGKPGLRWRVDVDHQKSDNPDYPVGWPRIRRTFKQGQLDLNRYDYLEFMIRVDSDRDEVADDVTPFGLSIRCFGEPGRLYEIRKDLGDQQQVWIPLRFSIRDLISTTALGTSPWQRIQTLQLFIAESDYNDQTSFTFDIASAKLLAFDKPLISRIEASRYVLLPKTSFPVAFEVLGLSSVEPGTHTVTASLVNKTGRIVSQQKQDLAQGGEMTLVTSKVSPGNYNLEVRITTTSGEECSKTTQTIEALTGPFFEQ